MRCTKCGKLGSQSDYVVRGDMCSVASTGGKSTAMRTAVVPADHAGAVADSIMEGGGWVGGGQPVAFCWVPTATTAEVC
jgi:hypothetical protein